MSFPGPLTTNHAQSFKIKHTFRVAPFTASEQIQNFLNVKPPDYFKDGKALKYICKVDGKFEFSNPVIPHTGKSVDISGLTYWFNQNNIRSRAEYYFDSVTFEDADANELESLDIDKVVTASVVIKSRSGKFSSGGSDMLDTRFAVDFCYLPLNESRYVYTPDTTLRQNFLNDRRFLPIDTQNSGEYFGTEYQVLSSVNPVYVDAETVRVDIEVTFSAEIKAFLKTLPIENRYFFFAITTQDAQIETTVQTDNVPVLVPPRQIVWDESNPTLIEAVDNARVYHFPQVGNNPRTTVGGYEGDPVYIQFPFTMETASVEEVTPTLMSAGFQVVVVKEGEDDFVLEEKIFDTSLARKLDNVQTIDISESKNYRDMEEEYNTCSLITDSSFDNGTKKGFLPSHAFILRYDWWSKLIADSERFQYDIFRSIENPSQAWSTLEENGWTLKVKFLAVGKGYTGLEEPFYRYIPIRVKALGAEPDVPPFITSEVKYEDYDTGIQTRGITAGGKTLITRTYSGNFAIMPDGYDSLYAYIFADLEDIGGVNNRRFASTEFDSEEDCPFIAPDPDEDADYYWQSNNVTINIFNFDTIIVTTIFDDTTDGTIQRYSSSWNYRAGSVLIFPRLGFMQGCFVLQEVDGEGYVLDSEGQRIPLESCDDLEEESHLEYYV